MQKNNNKLNYERSFVPKHWYVQTLLTVAVLLLLSNTLLKKDKIVYVDAGKIMSGYKGFADAKKSYQAEARVWQANVDTLTSEIRSAIQQYEKSLVATPKKQQQASRQAIQAKQKQLNEYQNAVREKAKQEEAKVNQAVVVQINSFLSKYGKEKGYTLILIANQSGTIAYAKEGLDITPDVTTQLNKEYIPARNN